MEDKIYVTRPSLPPLSDFMEYLEDIWKSKWLTNAGKYHDQFEKELVKFLGVKHCSLLVNGTLGLVVGLQGLRITGEVITTPYSFVATTHSLNWNGIKPVFCDIEEDTLCLDPRKLEPLITPRTTAILPVHVYGHACDVDRISEVSDFYGLKVIYDAAHAFGVRIRGKSILNYGDMSVLSFHATKVFNTIEGGAIVTEDEKLKKRIDFLKNFGYADELTVVGPGINARLNELQAAYGLLGLKVVSDEIEKRRRISHVYAEAFGGIPGLKCFSEEEGVDGNFGYFPILIDENEFGKSRDTVYENLKQKNIFTRRYFYPLISRFPTYRGLASASPDQLPVAEKVSTQILCLPIYASLSEEETERIVDVIRQEVER